MIIGKTGSNVELKHSTLPVDDPKQRRPDIGLAHALLGWEPKMPLDEGLDRTVSFFRSLGH